MKWRKFVPAKFADEICPKPHDDILKKVQEARSEKNRERNTRKKARPMSRREGMTSSRGRGGRGRGRGRDDMIGEETRGEERQRAERRGEDMRGHDMKEDRRGYDNI